MEYIDSSMVSTGESQLDEIASYKTNVLSYYKYNMSIAHININSIWNKIDEVELLLNEGQFHFLPSRKPSSTLHIIVFTRNTQIIGC